MTKGTRRGIIGRSRTEIRVYGGIAQLARASGSYPAGRWFKSDIRYHSRLVGQAVKTRPFHGCNSGSIPLRVTNGKKTPEEGVFFSFPTRSPMSNLEKLSFSAVRICREERVKLACKRQACKYSISKFRYLTPVEGAFFSFPTLREFGAKQYEMLRTV